MADLEKAILQGVDSKPLSSYREDRRAETPEPTTDDELGSDLAPDDEDDLYNDNDEDDIGTSPGVGGSRSGHNKGVLASKTAALGARGASNTGPKGVLRDQRLRLEEERQARISGVHSTNARMGKLAMSSESYSQQVEREKREARAQMRGEDEDSDEHAKHSVSKSAIADLQAKERRREIRLAELKASAAQRSNNADTATGGKARWFGHLREVDERGYVSAIDNEDPRIPVVIHIYSKAVQSCNILTQSLSSLARTYPGTKFLQVPAAAIGFGKNSTVAAQADEEDEEYDDFSSNTLEVLPTLLVYKAGTLVANLVRIDLDEDWNGGQEQGLRNILEKYHALESAAFPSQSFQSSQAGIDDPDES